MTLAEKVRAERAIRKMTQAQFAALVGVDQPYISKWERGGGVDLESATLLAKATDKPVEYYSTSRRLARARRASIDAVAKHLSDADHKTLLDSALRFAKNAKGQTRSGG